MITHLLIDIEGTTAPISFVKEVLFPYSYQRLADFLLQHQSEPPCSACIESTRQTIRNEQGVDANLDQIINQLLQWIIEDRKHPALKELQGMIWKDGYEDGSLKSHLYDDVLPQLQAWKEEGKKLYIYSSGSVEAQKLFYSYTDQGDLNHLWDGYFDTTVGGKKEKTSYEKILSLIKVPAKHVLFLSDVADELNAAYQTGIEVKQVVRAGTIASNSFQVVYSFTEILI
jgi:enolase-phosphatase E1